uniref:Uncharacterized protein n=1 Tax=Rhizophora mucronata TaxID=61149 RepID=A0A2P2PL70_RHIMU
MIITKAYMAPSKYSAINSINTTLLTRDAARQFSIHLRLITKEL